MTDDIVYTKDGAIASLRFNRPAKKNAITVAMYSAMAQALHDAADDPAVKSVGLYGGSDFTAGNDIGDFVAAGGFNADMPVIAFLKALAAFPKPLVAAVRGAAIGIGTTMLMHCDAVVCAEGARFALPFTKLGLVPEAGSSLLFPLIAGRMRASWWLLSGEQFGAQDARDAGLVTRVVADEDVDGAVAIMCGEVAELPPDSVATTKRLLKANFREALERTMTEEVNAFARALGSDEARGALLKFMQRS